MHRRVLSSFLVVVALLSFGAEAAHARRGRGSGNYSSSSSGMLEIAPYSDSASAGYRTLAVYYNYNRANAQSVAFTDKLRVYLAVSDSRVLSEKEPLVAEVKIADLSNDSAPKLRYFPVLLEVGSSRVDLQACKLEYSIVSPK